MSEHSQGDLSQAVSSPGPSAEAPVQPIPEYVEELVTHARQAANRLATLSTSVKNQALLAMADALEAHSETLLAANAQDIEAFGDTPEKKAMADRLRLTDKRIVEMADGIREVAKLPDPLGEMPKMWTRPNGMQVGRVRVPIGVIGIIYESRPNVTADSSALCLKSGNACVLRGGSEAIHSNTAIATVLSEAAEKSGVPPGAISFVARPDRELVPVLLKKDRSIDLIIPRGGESLMRVVT
ncbi:MAG TPA: aldehyde dehydrogenase family protein, partial [Nitrospira sp.]|nr:aldehyde dehydrogenase family protein [Nitrospira sp.]